MTKSLSPSSIPHVREKQSGDIKNADYFVILPRTDAFFCFSLILSCSVQNKSIISQNTSPKVRLTLCSIATKRKEYFKIMLHREDTQPLSISNTDIAFRHTSDKPHDR